jgi:predicted DNA-binding ArsR family transcriptional regulator
MMQAKLINDITDLSWLSRAFDDEVKREVFTLVSEDWVTVETIEEQFGKKGTRALLFFEKVKMVETRWSMSEDGKAKKEYHAFYTAFHINVMTSIDMIRDVFSVVLIDDKKFAKLEGEIYDFVGGQGDLSREVEKQFQLSPVQMRCLVKRSENLEYRGMKIEQFKEH